MSVKYNIVERGKPGDPDAPKKYYPSAVASGKTHLRTVAKRAAEMSTVSMPDTVAVIEALLAIIPDEMSQGNIVRLGEFGSFWVKVKTNASATAEEVNASKITGVIPRFTPGKEFKTALQAFDFEKK
ncbi:MAG: HU family DNA-binding protein [Anaerolineae bacterium]|nr:HU family DNA-binding protein [Anaerolineae bacterium]MBL6965123.1 HU family DNA-binding protein [Anaerolineales bacterium]